MSVKYCSSVAFGKPCRYLTLTTKPEVLHAESNAISKCAKWISSTEEATLYVTLSPCFECSKMIIQAGIKRVCYLEEYRDTKGIDFLKNISINTR
jgi:dCMP deaminase